MQPSPTISSALPVQALKQEVAAARGQETLMPAGVTAIAVLVLAVTAAWAVRSWGASGNRGAGRVASGLRWAACAVAVATALQLWGSTQSDSPGWAPIALGVPVASTALPLLFSGSRWAAVVLTWLGALGSTAWALLLGLGFGLALLPPALLLLAAAVAQHATEPEQLLS